MIDLYCKTLQRKLFWGAVQARQCKSRTGLLNTLLGFQPHLFFTFLYPFGIVHMLLAWATKHQFPKFHLSPPSLRHWRGNSRSAARHALHPDWSVTVKRCDHINPAAASSRGLTGRI